MNRKTSRGSCVWGEQGESNPPPNESQSFCRTTGARHSSCQRQDKQNGAESHKTYQQVVGVIVHLLSSSLGAACSLEHN